MFQTLLCKLAETFDKNQIPYMVIGGQAVLVYGEPRFTRDIDVTLGVGPDHLEEILRLVASIGLAVLVPKPAEFVKKTMVLPCESPDSGVRVDLVFSFSPYEQQAMNRVRRIRVLDRDVRFASPEDLMVHKIIAGRPRDMEDARVVLAKNPDMDKAYIERWLGDFEKALNRPLLEAWKKL
jgi:hypothetical protein